tara:strand:- start:122 stop:427 length:306 start_codon:yes stop_codon:yes gene_type:complete
MAITNVLLILVFFIILILFLSLSFVYSNRKKSPEKIRKIIQPSITSLKEKEFNPNVSTDNWDIHKLRLEKFRRSKYKGLTFFVSSENRIYYLSEEGEKVYC